MPTGSGTSRTAGRHAIARVGVDMHLHESHDEGGFGLPNNTSTRHAVSYDQRQVCCLRGHLCPPFSTGLAAGQRPPGSTHLGCLRSPQAMASARISTQAPRTTANSKSFFRSSTASTRHSSAVKFPPRCLPALRISSPLGPAPFHRNTVSRSSSPSNGPLRQHYTGTRFEEHRQLHLPQKHKATVPESTLRVKMNGLE